MHYINCRRSRANKSRNYRRDWKLQSKYGITDDEFKEILRKQEGRCLICETLMSLDVKGQPGNMATVDHDHKTKRFRGIICSACNRGLGQFKDNIDFLINAVIYLKSFDKEDFPATA